MADNPEGAVSVEHLCRFPQAATVIFRVRHLPGSAQRHLCCCTDSTPIPSCNTCPTFVCTESFVSARSYIASQHKTSVCQSFRCHGAYVGSVRLQRINDTLHAMPSSSGEPGRTLTKTKKIWGDFHRHSLSGVTQHWRRVLEPSRIFPPLRIFMGSRRLMQDPTHFATVDFINRKPRNDGLTWTVRCVIVGECMLKLHHRCTGNNTRPGSDSPWHTQIIHIAQTDKMVQLLRRVSSEPIMMRTLVDSTQPCCA